MKLKFYFFGLSREKKSFTIVDPIEISKNCNVYDLTEDNDPKINDELKEFLEEYDARRGLLFGLGRSDEKIKEFFKKGTFLEPNIQIKKLFIYFLEKEKGVLFKINKRYSTRPLNQLKKIIWSKIRPLKLISEKEFKENTKDWKQYKYSCHPESMEFESEKLNLSVSNTYYLYICIKTKNYNQLKNKVKKVYKSDPKKPIFKSDSEKQQNSS